MAKRRISLLLALLALTAFAGAQAEEFVTSRGVRNLSAIRTLDSAAALRQAAGSADRVLDDLLADIAAMEGARIAVAGDVAGIGPKVKAEQAAIDKAKAAFDALDQKYKADLAGYQGRQVAINEEIQRQRGEAAVLQALPSAQQDRATIERLNAWAQGIGARRATMEQDRAKLLLDHESVESERVKLEKARAEAEARLRALRDSAVDRYGATDQRLTASYGELRRCIAYLEQVRALLRSRFGVEPAPSPALDRAMTRLRRYEARVGATKR